jgi:hypothetical protein
MTPNRIVALITPVCALTAGWAASWLADNVPGVNISRENLQAVFIAGALAVVAPALQWLHGWQKWEGRQEDAIIAAAQGFPTEAPTIAAPIVEEAPDDGFDVALEDDDYDDFDDLLDADEFEDTSVADEEEPVIAGS